jgi:nitrate reductase gamma subunit
VTGVVASVVPWFHPLCGLVTVALLFRAAQRGLALRRGVVHDRHLEHPTLAFLAWLLVVVNWVLGLATVWLVRDDLEVAASTHFQAGTGLLGVLTLTGLVSLWIADPRVRRIHPMLGAVALLLAGVQVFLGLQMTRW